MTRKSSSYMKLLGLGCALLLALLPSIASVHAVPGYTPIVVSTGNGTPSPITVAPEGPGAARVAALVQPLTYYAEVIWQINSNHTVKSSTNGTAYGCVNLNLTPCFSLQLTTSYYSGGSYGGTYQWVFFVDHGQNIIACGTTNTSCDSTNECTFGSNYPSDGFSADTFYIKFTSATAYTMELDNSAHGAKSCTPGSINLTGLVSWEVSAGIGYISGGGTSLATCAVWATGTDWSVAGFAPSGVTMGAVNDTPQKCAVSGGSTYNGGNAIWVVSGKTHGSTGEACNLETWTWSYTSAQNFVYDVSN